MQKNCINCFFTILQRHNDIKLLKLRVMKSNDIDILTYLSQGFLY